MKLIFLTICLIIVLITEETLIVSGFHARNHRLLPLVIALMALYDFYLIVEDITGQTDTMNLLSKLLLIQILDVVSYYILDFMKIKISMWTHILIITLLIGMDVLVFIKARQGEHYDIYIAVFSIVSVIGISILVLLRAPKSHQISRQTRINNHTMGLALFIPAFALVMVELGVFEAGIAIPVTTDMCCIIIDYLFLTDRLRDVDSILKEENFHALNMAACLFDNDFFFLDASNKAKEIFPVEIAAITASPKHYAMQEQIKSVRDQGGVVYRNIGDRYYRLELLEARFKGKKKGYILTFVDMTDEKKETDMAKELARQKSEFLANMSHDLRSPLHAIIGSSEVALTRADMSSKSLVMVNHIHETGKNLLDIVNSILDFSKLESGELKLFPQKYSFRQLVDEQARQGFANLRDSQVELSVEISSPYPEYLYGDKMRVRQIVQNLISNAIKFTKKGIISCSFDIAIEQEDKVLITYSVKDTGVGMSKEQCDTIFDDYVTYAREQNKEGTGLGLSIVKNLCEKMGGRVNVESVENEGTTFTASFYQELVQEDAEEFKKNGISLNAPTAIHNEDELQEESVWKNNVVPEYCYPEALVLLADDMTVNCEIFKDLTAPWGFRLDIAQNGEMAVEMAKAQRYDLIFLDQMMPVMSGLEAADKMHESGVCAPMILLSANITESLKAESKAYELNAFMTKPIDIAQLKIIIEEYLPEKLREQPEAKDFSRIQPDQTQNAAYMRALETYAKEVEELCELLPGYAENDLNMFRNKVHGLKGVSRQMGMITVGGYSEVMEMAAITEHHDFIERFLPSYMDELRYIVDSCKMTLEQYEKKHSGRSEKDGPETTTKDSLSEEEIKDVLDKLEQALIEYDMGLADEALDNLSKVALPDAMEQAFEKIKSLYEDMEYDEALKVLQGIVS